MKKGVKSRTTESSWQNRYIFAKGLKVFALLILHLHIYLQELSILEIEHALHPNSERLEIFR